MSDTQRWTISTSTHSDRDDTGNWVRYTDHVAALTEARQSMVPVLKQIGHDVAQEMEITGPVKEYRKEVWVRFRDAAESGTA